VYPGAKVRLRSGVSGGEFVSVSGGEIVSDKNLGKVCNAEVELYEIGR